MQGEEDCSTIEYSQLIMPDEKFPELLTLDDSFKADEATLYIDPLDGTHCLLRG